MGVGFVWGSDVEESRSGVVSGNWQKKEEKGELCFGRKHWALHSVLKGRQGWWKKQVTVAKPSDESDSTTHPHVVTVKSQKTNVPVPPSTGVNNKMADLNAPSGQAPAMAPPLHADDQILPHIRWVPIGERNCYLDLEKSQSNPIYKIVVDLLKNTNFFTAFTTSSTIPSIYIQQFMDMILYDKKAGCYRCQLDEQWFVLTKETLKEALHITPVNNNQAFAAPLSIDGLIDFVNQLGYPKEKEGHSDCDSKLSVHQADYPSSSEEDRFYPRPDSPLHMPNEEPVLGYLKFSAKGTKRGVFGMPIPGSLITVEIQQASYYREYLANADQHRSKKRSQKNVEASKTERVPTAKPQVADEDAEYQKVLEESMKDAYALPRGTLPPVVIREPESGKYQPLPEVPEKGKAKVTEEQVAHDLLSLQKHKKTSHVDQYIFQRRVFKPTGSSGHDESPYALLGQSDSEEESKKVVLRAKEGGQDEGQTGPDPDAQAEDQTGSDAGAQAEDQTGSDTSAQANDQVGSDAGAQAEGQTGLDADETFEGQAGSNPDETSEGLARPDPGDAEAKVQFIPSHVVHVGSDREHMDLDVADVSPQPSTKQLNEGFTETAYLKVQENLKLSVEEQVLLEEPASSSGTLSSLQHLSRDFSFGDQFFNDKPSDADKNAETKVESMVNVTIQQSLSLISLMTSPIIDLTLRPESPMEHQQLKATTTNTTTTTTTFPPPQAPQQSTTEAMMVKRIGIPQQVIIAVSKVVTNAVDWAMQAPLCNRFRDLPEADIKEILHQRMWESDSYKSHEDHMHLFEALEKSMNRDHSEELAQDLAEARKKKKKSCESPKTPPGSPSHQPPHPPPLAGPSGASRAPRASGSAQVSPSLPPPSSTNQESSSKGSAAPSPSKIAALAEYQAWTTIDIRLRPSISLTRADLEIDEDMALNEQAQSSNDEDIGNVHIPIVNLRQGWWKPFEEERPATSEPAWSIRSSDVPIPTNNWASALASNYSPLPKDLLLMQTGPTFEIIKVFHPDVIHLQYQMEECHKLLTDSVDDPILRNNVNKPLPLGGPPGQVTIQSDFFFNKDLDYLRYGSKGSRPALSIVKMKAAYLPDAEIEQMVPDQFWINEECKYNIAAIAVRRHIQILSVVRIEVFSMYGYDYMKKIVLHRADLNEHVIAERDFKYLYPSDFEDLYLLNLQEDFQLGIESYLTQVNLTKPQWMATGFEYKHDYTVIKSPRDVIFRDKYGVQMMMRFNEIHKFSDRTLQQIDEALDYRVKEFRINKMNPGLNTRFWTRKDVDRCNAFMFAIQRLKRTK
uniref:Histone deacetylase 14 n=1 Tax=Tanacetum cinerariifolium TaxID=118510 RepID=A0A6L2MAW8_TANCI|nr:histone deacetylase 14 [Tanacetum cinerariifolium]